MNSCDVSGSDMNVAVCGCTGFESAGCVFFEHREHSIKCSFYDCGSCRNLAAIRAAIEAERNHIADAGKMVDEEWMKKRHSDCKHQMRNDDEEPCVKCFKRNKWEPRHE